MAQFDSGLKPYKVSTPYDVDEKIVYSRSYRPDTWGAGKEYRSGRLADLVLPPVPNGWMYLCSSGGISGATAPTFSTVKNGKTVDGDAEWKAIPYDLLLNTGDSITGSTWVGTNGEIIDNESIVSGIQTKFRLTGVALGAKSVTITNHIVILRADGEEEFRDRSIIIPVKVL